MIQAESVPLHAMNAHMGSRDKFHLFLSSARDGGCQFHFLATLLPRTY